MKNTLFLFFTLIILNYETTVAHASLGHKQVELPNSYSLNIPSISNIDCQSQLDEKIQATATILNFTKNFHFPSNGPDSKLWAEWLEKIKNSSQKYLKQDHVQFLYREARQRREYHAMVLLKTGFHVLDTKTDTVSIGDPRGIFSWYAQSVEEILRKDPEGYKKVFVPVRLSFFRDHSSNNRRILTITPIGAKIPHRFENDTSYPLLPNKEVNSILPQDINNYLIENGFFIVGAATENLGSRINIFGHDLAHLTAFIENPDYAYAVMQEIDIYNKNVIKKFAAEDRKIDFSYFIREHFYTEYFDTLDENKKKTAFDFICKQNLIPKKYCKNRFHYLPSVTEITKHLSKLSPEKLIENIKTLLHESESWISPLGGSIRDIILRSYSIKKIDLFKYTLIGIRSFSYTFRSSLSSFALYLHARYIAALLYHSSIFTQYWGRILSSLSLKKKAPKVYRYFCESEIFPLDSLIFESHCLPFNSELNQAKKHIEIKKYNPFSLISGFGMDRFLNYTNFDDAGSTYSIIRNDMHNEEIRIFHIQPEKIHNIELVKLDETQASHLTLKQLESFLDQAPIPQVLNAVAEKLKKCTSNSKSAHSILLKFVSFYGSIPYLESILNSFFSLKNVNRKKLIEEILESNATHTEVVIAIEESIRLGRIKL